MASTFTAADVEASRRRNLEISEEKKAELDNFFHLPPGLLLTSTEVKGFEEYRTKFHKQVLNSKALQDATPLHAPLVAFMNYSVEICGETGIFLFLSLFKHYCPNPTEEQLEEAYFMAWAIYVVHGVYTALDDFADRTPTRRFKPAYHVQVGNQLSTMHTLSLLQAIDHSIDEKFAEKPFALKLGQIWTRDFALATIAQTMDVQQQKSVQKSWDFANRDHQNQILYPCLHDLPMEIAALLADYELTSEGLVAWREFIKAIQNFMRNVNDMNDVYPAAPTGKPLYTDIANGTSSWCSTKAWQLANEDQRAILETNYGIDDNEKIANVLQVYEDVNLKKHIKLLRNASIKEVVELLGNCPETIVPKKALLQLFNYAADEHGLAWH